VIVDPRELPPLTRFPQWMELATRSRLLLPVGWHWGDSVYARYYRAADATLDPDALAALGATWVVATNLWGYPPRGPAAEALRDAGRFVPAADFRSGAYDLRLYRVSKNGPRR
jgi:hypothetical protein